MVEGVLQVHFPRGALPATGLRCRVCLHESLPADEVQRVEALAHELGLFGIEDRRKRKLIRAGNSLAVTIDPELAAKTLGTDRPGIEVSVGRMGKRIVVEAD